MHRLPSTSWPITLGVVGVFAVWQLINHLWLMELPMAAYHLVSFAVEAVIAITGLLVLAAHYQRSRIQQKRAQEFSAVITAALALHHDLANPLDGLSTSLEQAYRDLSHNAEGTRWALEEALRQVGKMERIVWSLAQMMDPSGSSLQVMEGRKSFSLPGMTPRTPSCLHPSRMDPEG